MDYWFAADQIATLAAEVEAKGAAFYARLRQTAGSADVAEMCAVLGEQEAEHRAKFLALAAAHAEREAGQSYSVDISGMLRASMLKLSRLLDADVAPGPATLAECLAVATEVEATSILVYAKIKKSYARSFWQVLDDVLREEREHLRIVRRVRARLPTPPTPSGPTRPAHPHRA
jgi:rubrerythrin